MRVIAGTHRHRLLQGPPDDKITRPMPDSVKETVFNILRGHCEDQVVVDVFSGTGGIALEALSRGARSVLCIEQNRDIVKILRANVASLGEEDRCEVLQVDALGSAALARCPDSIHLVFFDPPYPMMREIDPRARVLAQLGRFIERLDNSGFAILRTPWPLRDGDTPGEDAPAIEGADGPETRVFGSMAVHLYARATHRQ